MTEVNLWSLLSVFLFQLVGALAHFRKMKKTKRVRGGYLDYVFADTPSRSAALFILLLGSSWIACTSGKADNLNPELLWALITHAKLHVPSIDALVSAVIYGFAFNSMVDKGEKK